jgi:hypothetical protein
MKTSLRALDHDIRDCERRIADDRAALAAAMAELGQRARQTAGSPTALLAAAGLGYVAGKLLFRQQPKVIYRDREPSMKTGMLGLIATALSLMQPGFGGGGIASWAAKKFWDSRKSRAARGDVSAPPPVRMAPRRNSERAPHFASH